MEETYAVSRPVAAALGGAPMLRRLSPRWLIPLTVVVLLLPSCSDSADDSCRYDTRSDDDDQLQLRPQPRLLLLQRRRRPYPRQSQNRT